MAKVIYSQLVDGIVGRVGTGVYYRAKSTIFGYTRNWVIPEKTEQNTKMGKCMRNSANIYRHGKTAWRSQMKEYAKKYSDLGVRHEKLKARANSAAATTYLMLWNWTEDMANIEFDSLTEEDFAVSLTKVINIRSAVENGYLPAVEGWEQMTSTWDGSIPTVPDT